MIHSIGIKKITHVCMKFLKLTKKDDYCNQYRNDKAESNKTNPGIYPQRLKENGPIVSIARILNKKPTYRRTLICNQVVNNFCTTFSHIERIYCHVGFAVDQ